MSVIPYLKNAPQCINSVAGQAAAIKITSPIPRWVRDVELPKRAIVEDRGSGRGGSREVIGITKKL